MLLQVAWTPKFTICGARAAVHADAGTLMSPLPVLATQPAAVLTPTRGSSCARAAPRSASGTLHRPRGGSTGWAWASTPARGRRAVCCTRKWLKSRPTYLARQVATGGISSCANGGRPGGSRCNSGLHQTELQSEGLARTSRRHGFGFRQHMHDHSPAHAVSSSARQTSQPGAGCAGAASSRQGDVWHLVSAIWIAPLHTAPGLPPLCHACFSCASVYPSPRLCVHVYAQAVRSPDSFKIPSHATSYPSFLLPMIHVLALAKCHPMHILPCPKPTQTNSHDSLAHDPVRARP